VADLVEARLTNILTHYWKIPAPESDVLRRALLHSRYSRPTQLRSQLALMDAQFATVQGARESDAQYVFDAVLSPRFVMDLLADLALEGRLTPRQRRLIEACVLQAVDAGGAWKPI
jgi:hypothetical protein